MAVTKTVTDDATLASWDHPEVVAMESAKEEVMEEFALDAQEDTDALASPREADTYPAAPVAGARRTTNEKQDNSWTFRQIHGKVFDANGQIVPDARIVLLGTSILAVSDFEGKFEMAVPDSIETATLVFSMVGFEQLNYEIGREDTFDVVMSPEDRPRFSNAFLSSRNARKRSADVDLETYEASNFVTASPKGGYKKFKKYLKKNTKTPAEAKRLGIKGTVLLSVQVGPSGELSEIKVKRGIGAGCDLEAIRLVQDGPAWLPAQQGNDSVESMVEIEVKFN